MAPDDLDEVCNISNDTLPSEEDEKEGPEISFNALSGDYNPRTLRLKGTHQVQLILILVDSGSTFNFIKPAVVRQLGLPSSHIAPFKVYVGIGDFIWCDTISHAVSVLVQGILFEVDVYHLDIAGADLVFGLTWLQSLGRVLTDYNLLTMEFVYQNVPRILYAENLLHLDPLKHRYVQKLLLSDHFSSCYHLFLLNTDQQALNQNMPEPVQCLLQKFSAVFQEPDGLPPKHDIAHHIDLKSGSKPI